MFANVAKWVRKSIGGDHGGALDKAKEAAKKERLVCRQREQQGLADQMNADLTYAVCLNLAIQHQHNGNDQEAMAIYYVCSNFF